jgi:2-hydroxy-3-oxopropionate reductase
MKLAFCGLGLMGAPMVRKLLAAGHEVTVWNRSPAKAAALTGSGAQVARTPAEAASDVDGALMCLFDAAAVESVVFGQDGIAQARGLKWLADHSSIPPDATRTLAQRLSALCGADWIDAPVSGGVAGVESGTLAVMAGGAPAHFEQAAGVMRAYAGNVTHMGASGAGQATKLCNQTIVATTVLAIAEAIAFAQRNGIDVGKLASALAGGWADSKPLQVFAPRMIQAQAQSIGSLATMLKDVDTVIATAQRSGAPMPLTATVQQTLRMAQALGLAQAELSAVISVVSPERREAFLRQVKTVPQ